MKINAKQMQKTVLRGLNKAGDKVSGFGDTVVDNMRKVVAGTAAVCAIAGAGYALGKADDIMQDLNKGKQSQYEQSVGEIAEKRGEFIDAGATEQVLEVFDEQNPQPEQPADAEFTATDTAVLGALGGGIGALAGLVAGPVLTLTAGVIGAAGWKISSAARKKEEEMVAAEEADTKEKIAEEVERAR
jgi:hypothetical protein